MSISAYAQTILCLVGQLTVFEEAKELVNTFSGAGFNAKQIERVCHQYGRWLEEADRQAIEGEFCRQQDTKEKEKRHYVSIDGSMYLTREQDWKEVKMARIYKEEAVAEASENRHWLRDSTYVGHLGPARVFLPKVEYQIEDLSDKIFLCDGARWIWNWVEDHYPGSRQIVDFYHAKEHLCKFADEYFTDRQQRSEWISEQTEHMLEEGINRVIESIKALPEDSTTHKKRQQLLGYYQRHRHRMQYHEFREEGLQIGSGAIESAHKQVLQQRLKLAGQRWTMEGLQQMVQLRVAYKSGKQSRIKQLAQKAA
jgi:hypothetical protein